MNEVPIFDCHADILMDVVRRRGEGETGVFRRRHLDRLRSGGITGAVLTHCHMFDSPAGLADVDAFIEALGREDAESRDIWQLVRTGGELAAGLSDAAGPSARMPVVIGMEGLKCIQGDLGLLERMWSEAGLRLASLTQNDQNELATGHWGEADRGLTRAGRDAIRLMNELGILVDLAHANERCQREILALSTRPVVISHTSARAVYDNGRNYSDDQLRAVAASGGAVGCMTSAAALAAETDREAHTLARYLRHLEHIIGIIGIDRVILGLHYTEYLYPGPGFLDTEGLEDASASRNIIRELFARGCTQEDVEKIAFRNFTGIFEEATSRIARP